MGHHARVASEAPLCARKPYLLLEHCPVLVAVILAWSTVPKGPSELSCSQHPLHLIQLAEMGWERGLASVWCPGGWGPWAASSGPTFSLVPSLITCGMGKGLPLLWAHPLESSLGSMRLGSPGLPLGGRCGHGARENRGPGMWPRRSLLCVWEGRQ